MNIIYKRILNLVTGHYYFKDGFDKFVTLYPDSATDTLLRNGKMLFKRLPNGITILYKTLDDETTPFIELAKDQHFIFVIKSGNISGLLNITNFDESLSRTFKTGNILYFTNNPANTSFNNNNPEILSTEIIDSLRSPLFTYKFLINGNPSSVKLIVTNALGNPVSVGKDTNGNYIPETVSLSISNSNTFEQQIDLRDFERGRYLITIKNADESLTLKSEEIYVDEQLERENILGIVDIVYDTASDNLYGDTEEYKLQFELSESFWKYYIVNKSKNINFETDSLLISDVGTLNGSPYLINDFQRAYSSIEVTAKTSGAGGNSTSLGYSGGSFPAISFSGQTLSGGAVGVNAKGTITIINNDVTGYTISIGGVNFEEGTDFTKGATPAETANSLKDAINSHATVTVEAANLGFDILVNDLKTLVFSSVQKIPFFEVPKLKIELRKTSDNQSIVANLPNPSHSGIRKVFADRVESEVFVFI
jgi:hypothetical protein